MGACGDPEEGAGNWLQVFWKSMLLTSRHLSSLRLGYLEPPVVNATVIGSMLSPACKHYPAS